jgi:hypothetical protein
LLEVNELLPLHRVRALLQTHLWLLSGAGEALQGRNMSTAYHHCQNAVEIGMLEKRNHITIGCH